MKYLIVLVLLCSMAIAGDARETKVALKCADVSEAEARQLLNHYCRDFRIVADESDYSLILVRKDGDDLPYLFTVLDSVDGDVVEVSKRSHLSGAVKDACSAMHIRFGERQGN